MTRSINRIKSEAVEQLRRSALVDDESLEILVQSPGKVTLTGNVKSLLEKRAASQLVWRVLGVSQVENKIRVIAKSKQLASEDEEIKSRINKILLWNSNLDSSNIMISVDKGSVTLEGVVDSFWKTDLIEDLISQLSGVRNINLDLKVEPSEDREDEIIEGDIFTALKTNISVDAESLDLDIENGSVRVSGIISSSIARDAILETIKSTAGVKSLIDDLKIRY